MAAAASKLATTAGTKPVANSTTMAISTPIARLAPGPSGNACRRMSSGESTDKTSGLASFFSSASHAPRTSRLSPTAMMVSRAPRSWPLRWMARTTKSPLSVTMPGKIRVPTRLDRGGTTNSATPLTRSSSWPLASTKNGSLRNSRFRAAQSASTGSSSPRTISTSPWLIASSVGRPRPSR